jgi:hypothetical protein
MSPIFVRPVREQLEHDRLIRHLQAKYKKKQLEVAINVGDEQVAPVKIGALTFYPDLVITAGKRLAGIVEVESAESVNNLEAMAQWVHFSKARVPFHLYVPVSVYDAARRLSEANRAAVSEIWTYRASVDGFDLVRMFHDTSAPTAARPASRPAAPEPKPKRAAKPAKPSKPSKAPKAVAKPSRSAAKPARKAARSAKSSAGRRK